jgi:hypothetical protein
VILEAPRYDAIATGGESDAARFVAEKAREARRALCETYTFGHAFYEALQGLVSVKKQCTNPDWDGYGAEAVKNQTIWSTYRFLEAIPPGLPAPSVGAEPDGDITVEWYRSPRRTLSVSISPDDNLHYSALLGPNKQYGTEVFFGAVPDTILDLIRRVHA